MSDTKVPILECRIGTSSQDSFQYIEVNDNSWLHSVPWNVMREVRVLHRASDLPIYYRRKWVSEDEAYDLEQDYINKRGF